MPVPIAATLGILEDNLARRGSVLPIPAASVTRWSKGLNLPRGGETVLYTGQMYQLIPYIEELVKAEEKLGASPLGQLAGLGRQANRLINISALMARPSAAELERYARIPRNVALLLQRAGVPFGSLYERDLYSGALIYDLGLDETFAQHARRVQQVFTQTGVQRVITIDPHTTHMLRTVYPEVLGDFNIEVQSYLEVLAALGLQPEHSLGGEVVIHDSCVFARYEDVTEPPRDLLRKAGLAVVEPEHSGKRTWCCGGPAESLFPAKAAANAARRVAELQGAGSRAVTMCPICFVNLSKASDGTLPIADISDYLRQAFDL